MVALVQEPPGDGGSAPLLMREEDGTQWWVKLKNNRQGAMVLVNEQIVARCGALIGAPTCEVAIVVVPETLEGIAHGVHIKSGFAHGSRHVQNARSERHLMHRDEDDNIRRHVGVYALHDWCWGDDVQWLYAFKDNNKTYSHDHGHFFPDGPNWNSNLQRVRQLVQSPRELNRHPHVDSGNLDQVEILRTADKLSNVSFNDLLKIMSVIPTDWPVSNDELACISFFLEHRAPQVAERMLALTGG